MYFRLLKVKKKRVHPPLQTDGVLLNHNSKENLFRSYYPHLEFS